MHFSHSHLHDRRVLGLDVRGLVERLPGGGGVAEGEAALGDADVALDEGRPVLGSVAHEVERGSVEARWHTTEDDARTLFCCAAVSAGPYH